MDVAPDLPTRMLGIPYGTSSDLMSGGTLPFRFPFVNTLFQMETRGTRLRRLLIEKTGGSHGWVNQLATDSGVRRQTISAWMSNRTSPDVASLRAIGDVIGLRTYEIVAAMDGETPLVRLDDLTEEALRELIDRRLDERLGPPKADHRQAGAA